MKDRHLKKKNSNLKILFLISILLLVYFLFISSKDKILNYPRIVLYGTYSCIFFISSIFMLRYILKLNLISKQKNLVDKFIIWVIGFIKVILITWMFAGIILIPFNFSLINYSKDKISSFELVEIEQLSARARNDCIFFRLNGRMNVIYGHKPIMNEIYRKKDFNNYWLELYLKEGLLGSYILISWDVIEK